MTKKARQKLREAAIIAIRAPRSAREVACLPPDGWVLQTSNSFRRIGLHGDGDVLCATLHPVDRQPDLTAPAGVLEYIIAAQPSVMLELLDDLDELETKLTKALEATDRRALPR